MSEATWFWDPSAVPAKGYAKCFQCGRWTRDSYKDPKRFSEITQGIVSNKSRNCFCCECSKDVSDEKKDVDHEQFVHLWRTNEPLVLVKLWKEKEEKAKILKAEAEKERILKEEKEKERFLKEKEENESTPAKRKATPSMQAMSDEGYHGWSSASIDQPPGLEYLTKADLEAVIEDKVVKKVQEAVKDMQITVHDIKTKVASIETKVESISTNVQRIDGYVAGHNVVNDIRTRTLAIETKVTKIEGKSDSTEEKVGDIETKVASIESKVAYINTNVASIEESMAKIQGTLSKAVISFT